MNGKTLLLGFLAIVLALVLLNSTTSYAQGLDEGYDSRAGSGSAVTPFEEDDAWLRHNKVNEIVQRIQRGDKKVLSLVTYDTFEAVHDEVVRRAYAKSNDTAYYEEFGQANSLPAFIGGFNNQDPKVRLKCVGYLGDWIDEIGKEILMIETEVDKRLASTVETRKEVRYGYNVLKMKCVRKRIIDAVKRGDDQVLITITPQEFMPLVLYEPRIRTILLGRAGAVNIRSIVLDRGVDPITGQLVGDQPGRARSLDIERICLKKEQVGRDLNRGEVAQYLVDSNVIDKSKKGTTASKDLMAQGVNAIAAALDTVEDKDEDDVDWVCLDALYSGLNNRSLFIREHTARIFLNYVKGLTGNPNYVVPNPAHSTNFTRKYSEKFANFCCDPYVKRVAQVAWDNVKWSEFYYWDRHAINFKEFLAYQYYFEDAVSNTKFGGLYNAGDIPVRYYTDEVSQLAGWTTEKTGNYRNDVKEINRLCGNEMYLDPEYSEAEAEQVSLYRSYVDTLFNDARMTRGRPSSPDRHDMLQGEVADEEE